MSRKRERGRTSSLTLFNSPRSSELHEVCRNVIIRRAVLKTRSDDQYANERGCLVMYRGKLYSIGFVNAPWRQTGLSRTARVTQADDTKTQSLDRDGIND